MEEPKYKRPTKSEQTSCTWCALSCSLKKRTVVIVFSRMRSKGSRFALEVWGLRVCSLELRLCSQPFATVRNRSHEGRMAVPVVSSAEGVIFGGFNVALLRFAWQAWHFVTFRRFCNVSKVVLCGRRNTFATFSQDKLQFSWQAQHFRRVQRHLAWQAQHFRRANRIVQDCVTWRQGANSVAGVAFCEMR